MRNHWRLWVQPQLQWSTEKHLVNWHGTTRTQGTASSCNGVKSRDMRAHVRTFDGCGYAADEAAAGDGDDDDVGGRHLLREGGV